ncbi:hypothetical protein GCM10027157_02490 [Corynebacterium aquatimens]
MRRHPRTRIGPHRDMVTTRNPRRLNYAVGTGTGVISERPCLDPLFEAVRQRG